MVEGGGGGVVRRGVAAEDADEARICADQSWVLAVFVFSPGGDDADLGVGGGGELAQQAATAVVDGEGGVLSGGADVDEEIAFFSPVTKVGVDKGFTDQGWRQGDGIANVFDGGHAVEAWCVLRPGDVLAGDIDARALEVVGAVIDGVDAAAD